MLFDDRIDAARRLAQGLASYRGRHALVLAIPRGAVPMGAELARALEADLDVVLVRKLGAPFNPEFAVGAIDEGGWAYVSEDAAFAGADAAYLESEKQAQLEVMRKRRAAWTPWRRPLDPKGRIAIVVDDGLATGATMIAALHAVRSRGPTRLVCAVPVASPESLERVRPLADEVVCLAAPPGFGSVGQHYRRFDQVDDERVAEILQAASVRRTATPPSSEEAATMKTERGNFRGVRKEQRMPETGDAYRTDRKPAQPTRCPQCKATYARGRWTWRAAPDDAAAETCPACRRIAEKMPAGYVTLRGEFTPAHRAEVLELVRGREAHAKPEHPLQRIMAIEEGPEGTLVTTTDVHLAREIAHALHEAFKGELDVSWNKTDQVLRATWTR